MVAFEQVLHYVRAISPETADDEDRAMLTLYLIDWKAAIELQRPISNLEWRIEHGPQPMAEQRALLLSAIEHVEGCMHEHTHLSELTDDDTSIIRDVVSRVQRRSEAELLQLVYSTFPVLSQPRHAPINLVAMADKYKREYRDQIR
jgi:hypothetical protein